MNVPETNSKDPLTGRVVLVAGASRGVGAAIAVTLAQAGAKLALAARSAGALATVAGSCGDRECALPIVADLTSEADVRRTVETAVQHFGRLDAAILNAAVGLVGAIEHFSLADWQHTLDSNLTSAFLVAREVIPHLRARRGTIIAIGSEFSRAAWPGLGAYTATRWGLLGLMQSLALELRPDGIKVSSILPGGILTDFGPDNIQQKLERQARGERFLRPEDVADGVCFLLRQPEGAWTQELNIWPR